MAKKSSKDVWRNFGFNLGFGARPWIRAFGEAWQHKLAEAIVSGKQTVRYDEYSFSDAHGTYYQPSGFIKVPNAAESFKKEAKAYLAKARKLAKLEQRYDPTLTYDESYIRRISSEQEIFNLKIIHGRRKLLDAKSQKIVGNIKEQIAQEFDVRERRKIYERAKKVEESLKRPAWQVIAESRGDGPIVYDEYPPVVGPTTQLRDEPPYQTTDWEGDLFDLLDDLESSSDNFLDESEDQMADKAMDDIEAFLEDRYA